MDGRGVDGKEKGWAEGRRQGGGCGWIRRSIERSILTLQELSTPGAPELLFAALNTMCYAP